jgi:hypothetical protein
MRIEPSFQGPGSYIPLIILLIIFMIGLTIAINSTHVSRKPQPFLAVEPYLAVDMPAGFIYNGTPTTALAGWYCIRSINSSNGYSIQLDAFLNNTVWVQDTYINSPNGQTGFYTIVWPAVPGPIPHKFVPATTTCAWLVITIEGGYVHIGYSLDGRSTTWYYTYPANATYILPGPTTELVLAGYVNGTQAQLGNGTLVYFALYYWNGTNWEPAPLVISEGELFIESVNHAWAYTSGYCSGYVAWFGWNKTNPETSVLPNNLEPICPTPPSFKP